MMNRISNKNFWILFFFLATSLYASANVSAETIVLKSGQTREGKILEKTDKYIKIDFFGSTLTYFLEDIERIDKDIAQNTIEQPKKEDTLLPLDIGNTWYYNSSVSYTDKASTSNPRSYSVKITGKETIDGKEVFIKERYDEKGKLLFRDYLSEQGNSLLCHKKQAYLRDGKVADMIFTPPQINAKLDAKPGEKWPGAGKEVQFEFVGKSEVETAAGKFVGYEYVLSIPNRKIHTYYAPEVGIVREITIGKSNKGEYKITDDLVKYTLANTNNPQN